MAKAGEPVKHGTERASAASLSALAPSLREPCRQSSVGIQQEPCRKPSLGIQGMCSALHPVPPCAPTSCPALQPHPARVCCRGSGLVTANESKTLTPGKAHVRSHRMPAENGKKHLFREASVLRSSWTVNVTNETFAFLLSFLSSVSFTPASA